MSSHTKTRAALPSADFALTAEQIADARRSAPASITGEGLTHPTSIVRRCRVWCRDPELARHVNDFLFLGRPGN